MNRTHWQVTPSLKFDALCLLNTLTGDPFYVQFNQDIHDHFKPLITPEAEAALATLKRVIKDEGHSIISAMLCLFFSAVEADDLPAMAAALDQPETIKAGLKQSPYYDAEAWARFVSIRDDLRTVFRFLESIRFPDYWQTEIRPQIEETIQGVTAYLSEYDVVSQLERLIGVRLPSSTITVYVLRYTRPHGIKVIGQRFITGDSWRPEVALRTAVHEMLHPPYDLGVDEPLQNAINTLQTDPFVWEKFSNHDADYGYNTFTGYAEENCVRALEQLVNESFNIGRDPRERWRDEDGGMHVLAAALYHTLKTEGFTGGFRDFLVDALQNQLAPGHVEAVYNAFYAPSPP